MWGLRKPTPIYYWCTVKTYKRSLKNLNPKCKVQQIFYYPEVLELFVIIQQSSIRIYLAYLFDITKENVGPLINSSKCFIEFFFI